MYTLSESYWIHCEVVYKSDVDVLYNIKLINEH